MSQVFSSIRARWLLSLLAFSLLSPIFAIPFIWPGWLNGELETPLAEAFWGIAGYGLAMVLLLCAVRRKHGDYRIALGPRPSARNAVAYALLAIPLIGIAIISIYAMFLPLSYVWPDEVYYWLIEPVPIIHWKADTDAVVASLANVVLLAIAAPIVEELYFRGFILNRWIQKYGVRRAVLFSSLAFGVLHADIIGATIFGIVLCMVYLRTNSLIGPIIVHIANNTLVVGLEVIFHFADVDDEAYGLSDFQSDWWLAIVGAAIGIPWLVWYWRKHLAGAVTLCSPVPVAAVSGTTIRDNH